MLVVVGENLSLGIFLNYFRNRRHGHRGHDLDITQLILARRQRPVQFNRFAVNIAQRVSRGEIGPLEVGFVSSAIYGKVPLIFKRMKKRYPGVSLVFQDLTSEEQVKAIKAFRLDAGFVRPPLIEAESLAMQVIRKDPWVVVLPKSHRLTRYKKIPIEALAEEFFLQVPRQVETGFYDQFIGICLRAGFSPKVVQEARSTQAIVNLIAGGMGISIVPASLQSFRRTGVVYRPLSPQPPTTDLSVIWRPDDRTPALHSFLDTIWEVVKIKPDISISLSEAYTK